MSDQKTKDNKQQLYTELKQLDEEIKKLNAHAENIDEQVSELASNKAVLSKFSELKAGDEMRVPLVSGVYFNCQLKDTKNVLVNVGANVAVEKSPAEVIEIFEGQIKELNEYRENLVGQMKALIKRIEEIQKEFE